MNVKNNQTVNEQEISHFAHYAGTWWDAAGPFRTLHHINPARLEWLCQYITPKGLSILDVGCGGGVLSEALAKLGAKVTGLDAEAGAIETARKHAKDEGLDIHYVSEALDTFKPEGLFDAIVCLEMLEHVDNPEKVIHLATKLLKPGGVLFLSTINRTLKAYLGVIVGAEYVLSILPRGTHTYERFIKPSELAAAVRAEALEVIGTSGLIYNPVTEKASLSLTDLSMNYLLAARRSSEPHQQGC